jgi:hypothetical protein
VGISAVAPLWAVEGGRISILGDNLLANLAPPAVRVGAVEARVVRASRGRIDVLVPPGVEGRAPVRVEGIPGATAFIHAGVTLGTGLHLVDNPVIDRRGVVYATFSGTRSQQAAVTIYRIQPNRAREPFVTAIAHPTGMAFGPDDCLYVTDRFEGTVSRVSADGDVKTLASGLGSPCGVAFAADGTLYVGDRTGSIIRVDRAGSHELIASLPPSVAAFHLAWGPDDRLYVSVPTLSTHDRVYRIAAGGEVEPLPLTFGRPQGLASAVRRAWLSMRKAACTSSRLWPDRPASTGSRSTGRLPPNACWRPRRPWGWRSIPAATWCWRPGRRCTRSAGCRRRRPRRGLRDFP